MRHFDVAIAGSGYAGSLMAMVARRLGLSVVLVEKGMHPRVVIGESSTPLSNLLLETLADRYDLPKLKPLAKWGTWQETYPEIGCGLKRGFTFFHHRMMGARAEKVCAAERQLLVAASPNDAIADTHWFRADCDELLVEQAKNLGVAYLDECEVREMVRAGGVWSLACRRGGLDAEIGAGFVIDATGPRGLLHRALGLKEAPLPEYPATCALYSHFVGVETFAGAQQYVAGAPPYPPDAAALHHVFEGGWMWVLPFNNGWTSAGFAVTREVAERFGFEQKEAAWERLLETLPEVKAQFAEAKAVRPFTYVPQMSFRSASAVGEGWAMLPSAAGFVDPLLSTGFPLTLLGVLRLGEILERDWGSSRLEGSLAGYAAETDAELVATSELIGALYANMADFAMFRALSLLYFAAASYAETVRRLGKPERARSFLLCSDAEFGIALRGFTARARQVLSAEEKVQLQDEILAVVERFDVAGLAKRPRDACYPVLAEDLFAGADKVGASREEIEDLLRRSGFYASAS